MRMRIVSFTKNADHTISKYYFDYDFLVESSHDKLDNMIADVFTSGKITVNWNDGTSTSKIYTSTQTNWMWKKKDAMSL